MEQAVDSLLRCYEHDRRQFLAALTALIGGPAGAVADEPIGSVEQLDLVTQFVRDVENAAS